MLTQFPLPVEEEREQETWFQSKRSNNDAFAEEISTWLKEKRISHDDGDEMLLILIKRKVMVMLIKMQSLSVKMILILRTVCLMCQVKGQAGEAILDQPCPALLLHA